MKDFLAAHAGTEGCWVYPSARDQDGYAFYSEPGFPRRAHRAAFLEHHGHLPTKGACHSCDNPPCSNPAHLFDGSAKENYEDARRKGRNSRGERGGTSKLKPAQVLSIRADTRTQVEIAKDYGVRQTTISEIKRGNRWQHLA